MKREIRFAVTTAALCGLLLAGCAQNTELPMKAQAEQTTPAKTQQDQATQGSQVTNYFYFGAPGGAVPMAGLPLRTATTQPGSTAHTNAGWVYAGNSFAQTITTGGTTPSVTGTATATGTMTANPSQSTNPTQRPQTSLSASAAGAMPGGAASSSANNAATFEGGDARTRATGGRRGGGCRWSARSG